jgi:hypothetical protein
MLLEDLYQRLSYGELNNLSMGADGNGSVLESAQPRIVMYANEALVRLYTTFVLRTNSLILTPLEYVTHYHLKKRFAYSERAKGREDYYYIQDLDDEPFQEDVIKVLEVFDALGTMVPLNDSEQSHSIFTPQAQMLQIPHVWDGQVLSLLYQASHPRLNQADPHSIIDLPEVLHGALTSYIAHMVYSHMNTVESTAKSQEHLAKFTSICTDVIEKDLVATSILQSNSLFRKRGWI